MLNLFSIFDPSSSFMQLNWLSMLIGILVVCYYWLPPNKLKITHMKFMNLFINEMKSLIKIETFSFMLVLFSMVNLIFWINLFGLLPYIFTPTAHIMITFSLSITIWLTLMIFGWVNNTNNMFLHLVPMGTPTALQPFMVIIESISNMIRPLTLGVRLAANLTAGHLLIILLTNQMVLNLNLMSIFGGFLLLTLELAVACIQAYVFAVLTCLYLMEIK
uniref:ATP synthase subunit a n=1 Tax=Bisetocreagris titanium TaxID=2836860 RepID=A0A8F7PVP8_9ARAC|nr:ATP synthase F0 subunit 6 [Bisetocreagris titanium]